MTILSFYCRGLANNSKKLALKRVTNKHKRDLSSEDYGCQGEDCKVFGCHIGWVVF
jgi:hypothetical protein